MSVADAEKAKKPKLPREDSLQNVKEKEKLRLSK